VGLGVRGEMGGGGGGGNRDSIFGAPYNYYRSYRSHKRH